MPCHIKGPPNIEVVVDRRGDGILFVMDSMGNAIYSPIERRDDEVIQWAINYIEVEFIRQSLENLYKRGEV